MRRVKIAACIVLVMMSGMIYLTHLMQQMGDHMAALSQEIITQTVQGADPAQITASLAELSKQWEEYELIAIVLAGRLHADSVSMSLAQAKTYSLTQEDEDLITSITELICNVRSMCVTERMLPENFS